MKASASISDETLQIDLLSEQGDATKLDFSQLPVSPQLKRALKRSMIGCKGHTTPSTQKQAFYAIKKFSVYLCDENIESILPLPANVLIKFRDWLITKYSKSEGVVSSTARGTLNVITSLLVWCSRNTPEILDKKTNFVIQKFNVSEPKPRLILDAGELKKILKACYEEIEKIQMDIELGQRLRTGEIRSKTEKRKSILIKEILKFGSGTIPHHEEVRYKFTSCRPMLDELGGYIAVNRILWLSPETILPFYLAILLQTSGNPTSILDIERSCIRPHPLRTDLEQMIWDKTRSGRSQKVDFPKDKEWGAPSIVRKLMFLTNEIVAKCNSHDADKLFLCRARSGNFGLVRLSNLHVQLSAFIKRNNLPKFAFYDLRRAGAVQHHLAAESMNAASLRLNHRSLATTARYTNTKDLAQKHESTIRYFQEEMVNGHIRGRYPTLAKENHKTERLAATPSETVFGFQCSDPTAGIAVGSKVGSLCLQFSRCATCPGAIIPLDQPQIVAKLLSALEALEEASKRSIKEGWWPRYNHLYEPTRQILKTDLIPAVDRRILELATALITPSTIPWLE